MKKIYFILIIYSTFTITSCIKKDTTQNELQKQIESIVLQMTGKRLYYPDSLTFYRDNNLIKSDSLLSTKDKKIITVISGNCSKCVIAIRDWIPYYQNMKINGYGDNLIILVENVTPKYFWEFYADSIPSDLIFIFDNKCVFSEQNKLPKNKSLNTFLVDQNNKIQLIGNPVYDKELGALYLRELQKK